MTLNQQKAIFEKAEIIAGINGAAFTNALFRYKKAYNRCDDFIQLDVDYNSDDGESLRLRIHRLYGCARGRWQFSLDPGAAGTQSRNSSTVYLLVRKLQQRE